MAKTSIRAKVTKVTEVMEVGANGFKKRELEVIIDGEYPEEFKIEFTGDKMDLLDEVMEDMYYTIHYNMRGRRVAAKDESKPDMFFVTLNGWKLEA
jgi:hypothetical protein